MFLRYNRRSVRILDLDRIARHQLQAGQVDAPVFEGIFITLPHLSRREAVRLRQLFVDPLSQQLPDLGELARRRCLVLAEQFRDLGQGQAIDVVARQPEPVVRLQGQIGRAS